MNAFDFEERRDFGAADAGRQVAAIRELLPGCESVERASAQQDRRGVDWVARLDAGAEVGIDVKTREKGCARYWAGREPELALEIWSKVPEPQRRVKGQPGWTLSDSSRTDYTLHLFDPSDSAEMFLLPFQLLRAAFVRRRDEWRTRFRTATQDSGGWKSECAFIPAPVVLAAIAREMRPATPTGSREPPLFEEKLPGQNPAAAELLRRIMAAAPTTRAAINLVLDKDRHGPLYPFDLAKWVQKWAADQSRPNRE
jgi:hypothetical protein